MKITRVILGVLVCLSWPKMALTANQRGAKCVAKQTISLPQSSWAGVGTFLFKVHIQSSATEDQISRLNSVHLRIKESFPAKIVGGYTRQVLIQDFLAPNEAEISMQWVWYDGFPCSEFYELSANPALKFTPSFQEICYRNMNVLGHEHYPYLPGCSGGN